jgi:hypothetical protein
MLAADQPTKGDAKRGGEPAQNALVCGSSRLETSNRDGEDVRFFS